MVKYENGLLVVTIETAAPEELHHCIMQSVINNLKNQNMSNLPIQEHDKEHNFWSLELLENLIPSVEQLQAKTTKI